MASARKYKTVYQIWRNHPGLIGHTPMDILVATEKLAESEIKALKKLDKTKTIHYFSVPVKLRLS